MKRQLLLLLGLLPALCTSLARTATDTLARGTGSFIYADYAPFANRPVKVYYHIPTSGDVRRIPIVFVMQGADRGYDYLLKAWSARAERDGFMVFIPQFDKQPYPLCDYQEAGVMNAAHTALTPRERTTPQLVDHLFLHVKSHTATLRTHYRLYGHSAGGQFVQRFMLFHDSPYVERAVIGSPGWYTMPDRRLPFSYGISDVPYVDDEALRRYFAKDIVVQLAECDTVREWFLRKTPEAERQGRNRLERGLNFHAACRRLCARMKWPFRWRLAVVPRLGHQSVEMGMQAVPCLLEPTPSDLPTPSLSRSDDGFASTADILAYMDTLAKAHPLLMSGKTHGTTPEGRPVRVYRLGGNAVRKPLKVWYMAGLHGNEPAGPEVMCRLAAWLVGSRPGLQLLDSLDIAILPVANPDGYDRGKRTAASGLDLNRDQTKLADPMSVVLKQAYLDFMPHVALDLHEFNPHRKEFSELGSGRLETAADVLLLPSGHLNVDEGLRRLAAQCFNASARRALQACHYAVGDYFTPDFGQGTPAVNKNARSPQSSSTWHGLADAVSLFVEIKGIGLGRRLFDKRVDCGFIVSRDYLQTACAHARRIAATVETARRATLTARREVVVTSTTIDYPDSLRFIDPAGDSLTIPVTAHDALRMTPGLVRLRPKAYLIEAGQSMVVEKLRALGIRVERLGAARTLRVGQYLVTKARDDGAEWEGIRPMRVATRLQAIRHHFAPEDYRVSTAQPLGNLLVTLMEPESRCGFVNFCVLPAREGRPLPIYRQE